MNGLDVIIVCVFILYSVTSLASTYFHDIDVKNSLYISLSNHYVMFTHLFIIPCVVIMWETTWYVLILGFSTSVSIVFHLSKIYQWTHVHDFEYIDVAFQNVLVLTTLIIVVFNDMPPAAIPFIVLSACIVGRMGDVEIADGFELFLVFDCLYISLFMLYLMWRFFNPSYNRNWKYVGWAILCGTVAFVTFIIAANLDDEFYAIVHSVWHVSAYSLLYFSLRSIQPNEDSIYIREIRVKRTQFA